MKVKVVNKSEYELPKYETKGSVGMDLRANLIENEKILYPNISYIIPTGIFIELPEPVIEDHSGEGYAIEAQIRPRSGLALDGITVVNAPGTIDSDYRGEIKVILMNLNERLFSITRGDKIAQMVFNRVEIVAFKEVLELSTTKRGSGGFGHTDKK